MKDYLSLVKFSHTVFALPFALIGYTLAISLPEYQFSFRSLVLVLLCMVFARNAAMAFNRYLDRDIDGANPRTAKREIPAGTISAQGALWFVIFNAIAFVITTYFINSLCFWLSPVALFVVLFYSYTKRFTALCHIVLGLGLAIAPVGAYISVTGAFDLLPIIFGLVVLFWVAGFDIIYAMQDISFDESQGLNSTPVLVGAEWALRLSQLLHLASASLLVFAAYLVVQDYDANMYLVGMGALIFIGLLYYQHTLVTAKDLSKVGLAFFTTNGIASVVLGVFTILALVMA